MEHKASEKSSGCPWKLGLWILAKSMEAVIGVKDFSSLNHTFIFELFPVFPKKKSLATPLDAERPEAA